MGVKWSEMTPRERDTLIATQVMGLDVSKTLPEHYFSHRTSFPQVIPYYTTDISAAWEVLEKLAKDHNLLLKYSHQLESWIGWFQVNKHPYQDVTMFAPTAPEAICLAALKAVGVDIE